MAVNTLVTGLIVFKIYKVFRDANIPFRKDASLSSNSSSTGGNRLRSIIFILIESGAALFCIQLIRLTVSILKTNIGVEVFDLIVGIHQMLNVSEYFLKKIPISTLPFLLFFIFGFSNNIFLIWQGLTPTIILVRVSMGLSFNDEKTMADVQVTMMRLYPSPPESDTSSTVIDD